MSDTIGLRPASKLYILTWQNTRDTFLHRTNRQVEKLSIQTEVLRHLEQQLASGVSLEHMVGTQSKLPSGNQYLVAEDAEFEEQLGDQQPLASAVMIVNVKSSPSLLKLT
jgi:hypothetical protein